MRGLVAVLLLLGLGAPAWAESPAEREARQRYARAQKLADGGHWAEALDEYQRSYELSRYPALLYRIALCQDQLGRAADAVKSYKQFLVEEPSSDRRAGAEARIAALERETGAPPLAPPTENANVNANASVNANARPRTPAYQNWWVWTIVGVVAAGAAVGIGVGVALTPPKFQSDLGTFGPSLTVHW